MDKLKMEARPIDELLKKVAAICPAAVQDNKIDFERLKQELSPELIEDAESYNFTWVGKKDAIMGASTPIRKTLRPCKEESKNWDTTKNLYIEGDNLDVLKLLQESYLGKVKMIYIDPPYNTGNDFVYCDDFTDSCEEYMEKKGQCDIETNERLFKNDETNGRFHSNWCTMIYPRLKVARDLLTDDGVIFVSIDENEITNLRKICDEIFGERNFINVFSVKRGKKSLNSQFEHIRTLNIGFEYLVCYSKTADFHYTNPFEQSNDKQKEGSWAGLYNSPDRPTMRYQIGDITISQGQWKWSKDRGLRAYKNYIDFIENGGNDAGLKDYWLKHKDKYKEETGFDLEFVKTTTTTASYWVAPTDKVIMDTNLEYQSSGDSSVRSLMGNVFSAPKPVKLISKVLDMVIDKDSLVLDFFSGSATTAHAIMQLNAEDDGNRRFIMVQLPELCDEKSEAFKAGYKNICEIGKERIRRAGDKIVADTGKSDLDIGFKVLKLDDTNMKDVYYTPMDTTQAGLLDSVDNIKEDRSELDLLYGVMLDLGLQLDLDVKETKSGNTTYYNVDDGSLIACFNQNIPDSIIKEIAELKPLKVVFRDSSFADAPAKINVTEIFKTISPNTKITVL